jgi:gamma-glutamyltranspeptidase / glutathione hydrolase
MALFGHRAKPAESPECAPAIHQPRIDASEGAVVIGDVRLPMRAQEELRARFDCEEARVQSLPMRFACPSVVLRRERTNSGSTEIFQPWGEAAAQAWAGENSRQ